MSEDFKPPPHSFINKFRCSFRGIAVGSLGQSSFLIHLVATVIVVATAAWLNVTRVEWCVLTLCITLVLTLELVNSCIEVLAQAIDRAYNERLRDALDIASAAVLVGAIGAAIVGLLVFAPYVLRLLEH